jgi:hypothetical protein
VRSRLACPIPPSAEADRAGRQRVEEGHGANRLDSRREAGQTEALWEERRLAGDRWVAGPSEGNQLEEGNHWEGNHLVGNRLAGNRSAVDNLKAGGSWAAGRTERRCASQRWTGQATCSS